MRAEYDSEANALAIELVAVDDERLPARGNSVHERANVAVVDGEPVDVELLYPDLGIEGPLEAAADKYGLDLEALIAAARSALAAPDRSVVLDIGLRS
jgi:hypothetical protein